MSVCACVCLCVCACMCVCTGSRSRLPKLQGLKLPEKSKGKKERARGGREGGREGSGREAEAGTGRLESFSPLCHTRHPQPQRGLLSRLPEVHCKSSAQQAPQSPLFPTP